MDENKSPLASEMYEDLKEHTVFLRKMVVGLLIVIGVLSRRWPAQICIISTN